MVTESFFRAVFCTLRVSYESWSTAGRAETTTHHPTGEYISIISHTTKLIACMQVHARRRPRRAPGPPALLCPRVLAAPYTRGIGP